MNLSQDNLGSQSFWVAVIPTECKNSNGSSRQTKIENHSLYWKYRFIGVTENLNHLGICESYKHLLTWQPPIGGLDTHDMHTSTSEKTHMAISIPANNS